MMGSFADYIAFSLCDRFKIVEERGGYGIIFRSISVIIDMNDHNNGTDDTSPTFKAFEEGSAVMSKESNSQLAIRQEKFIRDLKNAIIRIENKTYGICRVTGKLINKERLKLVPHATLSIEAKNIQK